MSVHATGNNMTPPKGQKPDKKPVTQFPFPEKCRRCGKTEEDMMTNGHTMIHLSLFPGTETIQCGDCNSLWEKEKRFFEYVNDQLMPINFMLGLGPGAERESFGLSLVTGIL